MGPCSSLSVKNRNGHPVSPAEPEPILNHRSGNTASISPFRDALRYSAMREQAIALSVLGLNFSGSPSSVCRSVSARSFLAIKRFAGRALAHVGEEICEGIAPTFANGYSDCAVASVSVGVRSGAARNHRLPRNVGSAWRFPRSGMAVPMLRGRINLEASARARVAGLERLTTDRYMLAAVATTFPMRAAVRVPHEGKSHEAAEALPGNIDQHLVSVTLSGIMARS